MRTIKYDDSSSLLDALSSGVQVKYLSSGDYVKYLVFKRKLIKYVEEKDSLTQELIKEYNADWLKKTKAIEAKPNNERTEEELILLSMPPVNLRNNQLICDDKSFFEKLTAVRSPFETDAVLHLEPDMFKKVFEECSLNAQDIIFEYFFDTTKS